MKVKKVKPLSKRCEVCMIPLEKKPEESMRNWFKKRTCGRKCGGFLANQVKKRI